ncbi:hypothetical protein BLX24_26045 [Arsenicibacter rosenii]|uniref:Dystroglycan-type cadherin-like domain-containing protein n=2 Tax=Arsenicibacter rosenii TaxID=1750698 RepID=A0A1S2VD41_9BACT|nr:hypothetical protein BLX24_26045 [Arsenicibacter rosenii]
MVLAMSLSGALAQNGLQVLGINVPIGTTPTSLTQNFNSLSSGLTVSAAGLVGNVDGTYTNRLTVFASTGAPDLVNAIVPATGAYSFGNTTDRALGANPSSLNSTAGITPITLGVLIRNNSGLRISSMSVSYRGEQWYTDASGQSQSLTFDYARVAGTSLITTVLGNTLLLLNDAITTVPFTAVPALDFTSIRNTNLAGFPVALPTPTELDGNLAANSAAINGVITFSTPVENGELILLRWKAVVPALLDLQSHSLAIDDLVITPTLINNPPQVTGTIPAQTATVGVAVNIPTATAFTEPDGQLLSFSATGLPTGLVINPSTGVITGTPSVSGTSTVTVAVSDPQGNSAATSFSLQVNQPSATVTPTGQLCLGQPLSLSILPLNLPPLAVLTISGPNGVSAVVGGNGTATLATGPGGLPAGTNSLTLTATLLGQTILTVPVAVTVPNAVQSVINLVTSQTVLQGNTLTLTGSCPTGVLNYTSTNGTGTGNPTIPTGATGIQSYTVVCIDGNGCISPISVANVTVVGGGLSLLPGTPPQICLGQPLNLSLLGSGILSGLTGGANSGLISLSVTGPVGVSATVLGPGLLQVTGLPTGTNNLTVTAFLSGTPVANVALTTNVISLPAVQNLVSVSGLTGSTLNLAGTCPTGVLNYTSTSGTSGSTATGIIPVLTGSAGVQSYTVVCLDANGCISPISVVNVTLVNGTLTPAGVINPICLGNVLNVTLLGGNGLDLNLVSLSVTGVSNLNVVAGGPGVLTISGLPAGSNNLTVTAYLLGAPVASVVLPVTVLSVQPPSVASSPTVGQTYPAGQTSVSVTQGTNNPVVFTASCSGGGSLSYVGSNGLSGTSSPINVPTTTAGTVSYTAVCVNGGCVSQATVISVIIASPTNQSPVLIGSGIPSPQSGTVGTGFSSNVAAAFNDPDGNTLTFSSTPLPAGLSISPAGTISGTPTVAGTTTVIVTANDGQGGSVSDDLVLIISPAPNQPPVLVGGGIPTPQSATVTVPFAFSLAPYFADPEGGALIFTVTGTLPPGLSISPTGGVISGTPSTSGTYAFTVTAADSQSGSVSDDLTIIVSPAPNRPPVIVGTGIPSPQSGTVGIGFSTDVTPAFSDPDGNPLTFTSTGLPAGLTTSAAGIISGTPTQAGTFTVLVTADDGRGGLVSDDFVLVISPANQSPAIVGSGIASPQTATVNTPFSTPTAYAFNDPDGGPLSYSATGLPTGLAINSTNGIISGVPSVTGTFIVAVTARDPQGASATSFFTLNVVPQTVPNQAPQLTSTTLVSPQSATVGVAFSTTTAGAFTDPDGGPLSYSATGLPTGVGINPATGVISGTPTQSGSFPIIVSATDPQGSSVSTGFTLVVTPANQPPVVNGTLTSPQFATVNTTFLTNTSGVFTDPDGGPLSYSATGLPTGLSIGNTNGIISGAPSVSGTFPITVTASDPQGANASASFTLVVAPQTTPNQAPVLTGTPLANPQSGTVGVAFSTTTAGAFTDPDGGPLSFTATGLPNGVSINPATGVISGTPTQSGSFPVVVIASDPQGGAASTGFTLNIAPSNQAPVLVGGGINSPQSATVAQAFVTPTAYAFNDPDGGPLSFTATGLPAGLGINSTNGIISGVPSVSGVFAVTVTATDPASASVSSVFILNVSPQAATNQAPVLSGTPLANPQSGTVGVAFSTTTAGAFTDPDGGPLSFTATGLPTGLSINPTTGVISGSPTQSGSFPIVVTAMDPQGGMASTGFTLNIAPANQPPVLANGGIISPQTATVNVGFVTPTAYAFSDPDGGPLSYSATGLPTGLAINPSSGIISGAASVTGTFLVTVTARDPQGAGVSSVFTLNVSPQAATNQSPVLSGTPLANPQSATVGVAFSTTTAGAFTDPDGGPLSFTATGLPTGLSINPTTGVISGSPTQSGSFPIIVTATDPQGANVSAGFILNVTPSNQTPVLVGGGLASPQTATVNTAFVTPTAYAFNDPDGGPLSYSATGLPTGITINSTNGIISGSTSVSGVYAVTVTARDPQGASVSSSFVLNVVPQAVSNLAPQVVGNLTSPQFATVNAAFSTTTAGAFFDVDPLMYTAIGLPAGLNINPATGVISGVPSVTGNFPITITATDPQNASAATAFTLIVNPAFVVTTPLGVTVISYNCATGDIVFGRTGGDPNRPVEYLAIGVKGWSTSPSGRIESELRSDPNQSAITVFIRYVGEGSASANYAFNFRTFCSGQGNQPPVYNGTLANQTGTVGVPFTYTFPANAFTDPEGQALTYTATGLPAGLSLSGQTISGTPGLQGAYGVTIMAMDPQGASQTGTFTITINPAPVVGGPLTATVLSYNCQTGDIVFGRTGGDPNRPVEYMAIGVRGYSTNPNARIESELRNDQNQSTITVMARYTGDPASAVTYVFNFRTFCSGQANQPPVYNGGLPNLTGTVGVPFSYTLPAGVFTDPEGQSVTFGAAGLPAGIALVGRVITGTPTQQGVYTPVYIFAQDPQGSTGQATITFTVNPASSGNQAPVVTGTIPSQTATVGIFFTYTIPGNIFTDPEGQPLTYTLSGAPRRLEVNGNVISGFPLLNGNYPITVTATDPQGGTASTSFLLTVLPNNTCGSAANTIGQPLQLLQPDYNCQTGVIKFNTAGGNGSTITYSAIGITVPTTDCFDQMDTEVAQDVRNDKPNVEPFIIRAQQNGVIAQYAFDARGYCRSLRTGREAIDATTALEVTVLGNPTLDEWVDVDVRGAEGQLLRLRVANPDGTAQGEQWVEKAQSVQRVRVKLGRPAGAYLLQVNTPVKAKTVKVIRQ